MSPSLKRDGAVLAGLVAAFIAFQWAMEASVVGEFIRKFPWSASISVFAVFLGCLGAGAFFLFRSQWPLRLGFVTAIPVIAQLILQLTVGSDPAYPGMTLLLAIPYGLLFLTGAVLVGIPARRSHDRAI